MKSETIVIVFLLLLLIVLHVLYMHRGKNCCSQCGGDCGENCKLNSQSRNLQSSRPPRRTKGSGKILKTVYPPDCLVFPQSLGAGKWVPGKYCVLQDRSPKGNSDIIVKVNDDGTPEIYKDGISYVDSVGVDPLGRAVIYTNGKNPNYRAGAFIVKGYDSSMERIMLQNREQIINLYWANFEPPKSQ